MTSVMLRIYLACNTGQVGSGNSQVGLPIKITGEALATDGAVFRFVYDYPLVDLVDGVCACVCGESVGRDAKSLL
jgi:hypothetical protein